ncbi:cobyric acid synthase [Thiomicrorhabdus immobilis]|nr:cobyric acid synthase [Thiomicrorhabdus immobilis]
MHTLMIQGCTSDAGKSTLVAGLCRVLARRNFSVAPFKPQNMALNSAVTPDGGEIGRAQALQAMAAKVPLSVHMNPVLLKPNSDTGAQVILQGHSIGNLDALDYHEYKPKAAQAVFGSFQILSKQYQTILVEGAGSPAEVNLRKGDIANMGFAEEVNCPVILIADIDKGGVFAHIVGTLDCLSESERNRIKGFVINRFRGDIALLQDGLDWLESKTGKPVLGVLPYLHDLHLDAEDAISVQLSDKNDNRQQRLKVIAPLLPHISNHTDLDPLMLHPQVDFEWIQDGQAIPQADLVILPGSKSVISDLSWLKDQAWSAYLQKHLRYGGKLIGICGGLQMLGQNLFDPQAIESDIAQTAGLGLMPYNTTYQSEKQLINRQGTLNSVCLSRKNTNPPGLVKHASVTGYEIHQGVTDFGDTQNSLYAIKYDNGELDGLISEDQQIFTTYCHGLFDEATSLQTLLNWAGLLESETFDLNQHREQQIERLADTFESHLDIEQILNILQTPVTFTTKTSALNSAQAFSSEQIEAVYQTISQRRDMRHFLKTPISEQQLQRFLQAAHQAPSVGLMQPWRFIRVTDVILRQQLHDLVEAERLITARALNEREDEFMRLKVEGILDCAEVLVVALCENREQHVFGRRTLPEMDIASIGCAIQNLALAARAEGIGTGWVSLFDPEKVAQSLAFPTADNPQNQAKPIAILCLGQVEEFYAKPMLEQENWRTPQTKEEITYLNYWGQSNDK